MYYGDEIGMGDNINLPDRDGLRTPMQWDDSPNGGFSKADASRLRLPVIDDPVFGYRKVNVAAAEADPGSLLNWLRNMIRIRKQHPVFGAGRLTMLAPANKQILAYLRDDGDARVLVVANLSAETQKIGVNGLIGSTSRWSDLIDGTTFQTNQDIQLEPYGFHWLLPD